MCARNKMSRHPATRLLCPLPVPHRPWSDISLDFFHSHPYCRGKIFQNASFYPSAEAALSALFLSAPLSQLLLYSFLLSLSLSFRCQNITSTKEYGGGNVLACFPTTWVPEGCGVSPGAAVRCLFLEGLMLSPRPVSQPHIQVLSLVQRPDWAFESAAEDWSTLYGFTESSYVEQTSYLRWVWPQHSLFFLWSLPIPVRLLLPDAVVSNPEGGGQRSVSPYS